MYGLRLAASLVLIGGLGACGGGGDTPSVATSTTSPTPTTIAASGDVDAMVDVDGHALHIVCAGAGEPSVIIELGADQRTTAWNGTQAELAATNRTCVYERAGSGESEPGPTPRTSQVIADELHALLDAAGIATPIVLVSHSLGGLHAQAFADAHPDDLAGLVFVDPRTAEYELAYAELLTEDEAARDERTIEDMIENAPFGAEIEAVKDSATAIEEGDGLPDVRVVVLTAGVPLPEQPAADVELWRSTHQHLAAQSSAGRVQVVDGAEHEIWRTHSAVITAAVAEISASA
jgi:pimeloyl-ACP methyl ester carboxylesterase